MWPDPLTAPRDPDKPPPGSEEPGYGRHWWVISVFIIVAVGIFAALAIYFLSESRNESMKMYTPTPPPTATASLEPLTGPGAER